MSQQKQRQRIAGGDTEGAQSTREPGWIAPPVDIYEDSEGVTLVADLPGVTRTGLNIRIDQEALTLEGEAEIELPGEIEPLHVDTRTTRYRRTFTLSGDLDPTNISAHLKDGVATVSVPKRAEAKPRRIEVQPG